MAAPDFSVTIIYESMEAGKRAKRFSDQLIAEAAVDCALELNLWNFGVLGIPADSQRGGEYGRHFRPGDPVDERNSSVARTDGGMGRDVDLAH